MTSKFIMLQDQHGAGEGNISNIYSVFWHGGDKEYVRKVATLVSHLWKRIAIDGQSFRGATRATKVFAIMVGQTSLKIFTVKENECWELLACTGIIYDPSLASTDITQVWNQGDGRQHADEDDLLADIALFEVGEFGT